MLIIRRLNDWGRSLIFDKNRCINNFTLCYSIDYNKFITRLKKKIIWSWSSWYKKSIYIILRCEKIQWLFKGTSKGIFIQLITSSYKIKNGYLMIELFPKATKINKKNLYVYVVILFCVYLYIINTSQETIIFLSDYNL